MSVEFKALVATFGSAAAALEVLMDEGKLERTVRPDEKSVGIGVGDAKAGDLKCSVGERGAACGSERFRSKRALMEHVRDNHRTLHGQLKAAEAPAVILRPGAAFVVSATPLAGRVDANSNASATLVPRLRCFRR
jgi:hypothetical protein